MFRRKYWKDTTFSLPIEIKVTGIDKKGNKAKKPISYRLHFIDSSRYMQVYYQMVSTILLKEFIKLNVNTDTMIKKSVTSRIKHKDCENFLEYINFIDDLIGWKSLCCNKNY